METENEAVILLLLFIYLSFIFRASNRLRGQMRLRRRLWLQRRQRRILAIAFYLSQRERATRQLRRLVTPRRAWVWPRNQYLFEDMLAGNLPEEKWREHFCVSRQTFFKICEVVRPEMSRRDTVMRKAILLEKRVAISLHRLANGDTFRTSGLVFGRPKSTANTIKNKFCEVLASKASRFIKFPRTEDEIRSTMDRFENLCPFPQVVGAIDGTHIKIKRPAKNYREYYSRKRIPTILLQGVADSECKFIHVSTGYPGSMHDSRMLRRSGLYSEIEKRSILRGPTRNIAGIQIKPLLIGDPAYKLTTWLMRPYPETAAMSASQKTFNKKLSKARVVIEQSFGLLKGRWRCLMGTLLEDTERVPITITACCVLHNMCIDFQDDTPIQAPPNVGNNDLPLLGHDINANGRHVRDLIRTYFDDF